MNILNLVNSENNGRNIIRYKISKFPDGQQSIQLESVHPNRTLDLISNEPCKIKSRLNNFSDLELIICATKALRNLGVQHIELYIPYLTGARSDRKFLKGGVNYIRDVISPILNSLNFKTIYILDAHSDVVEACIPSLEHIYNYDFVSFAIRNYFRDSGKIMGDYSKLCFVSPDGGSLKKIYKLTENLGFVGDIITCSKHRDNDGKLTKTIVPLNQEHLDKDMFIVDDICDGGRTFINIAKTIRETQPERTGKIYLAVSHGIFSGGFTELGEYFDGIYCTNSFRDISDEEWMETNKRNFVKQMNMF